MAATDYFYKVGAGTATTLSSPGYTIGATSISVASTTNWPTDTGVTVTIDEIDASGERVSGTRNVFRGDVASATQINELVYAGGDANRNYSASSTTRVYIEVNEVLHNRAVDGILVHADQDGTLKAGAVDVTAVIADSVVTKDKLSTALELEHDTGWNLSYAGTSNITPTSVTNNGNRSYTNVYASSVASFTSEGMRKRFTRTVSAPTQCADLEASSSQAFTVTNAVGLSTGTTWTFKAKIKPESYGAMVIVAIDDGTNIVQMYLNASGQIVVFGGTAGTADTVTSYQSVVLNKWQDVTGSITIGTPTGEIRIDDVVVPSVVGASAATTMTISGDEEIYIGRNAAGTYFDGKICQVAIFNSIISDATLKTYSGQTMTGAESGCEGFWSLNGVLTDSSANGNTLVAGGGALATDVDSPFGNYKGGTLEYGIVTSISSDGLTETIQVPEGCALPTSGGISAVSYSTQASPYGFPKRPISRLEVILQTTFSSTATPTVTDVSGMTIPYTATGKETIRLKLNPYYVVSSAGASTFVQIYIRDSATTIAATGYTVAGSNYANVPTVEIDVNPTAGSHTYVASISQNSAGTMSLIGVTGTPAVFSLEVLGN